MKNLIEYLNNKKINNLSFYEYEKGVASAKFTNNDNLAIFVEYDDENKIFTIFDGGFSVAECIGKNDVNDKVFLQNFESVLNEFRISKEGACLFVECVENELANQISKMILAEQKILAL